VSGETGISWRKAQNVFFENKKQKTFDRFGCGLSAPARVKKDRCLAYPSVA
jgi:hypothetical protein